MHRGCAAAIMHGVLQQATTIKAMLGRIYPPLHFARTWLILRSFLLLSIGVGLLWYYVVIPELLRGKA